LEEATSSAELDLHGVYDERGAPAGGSTCLNQGIGKVAEVTYN
jgi:hypothetical protein